MRILLIGATGQIGFALTKRLSQTSHQTSILVRKRGTLPFPENIRILEANVFTAEVFEQALADVDIVIYGVGLPEQFTFDKQLFERTNLGIFGDFLKTLRHSTVRRLIYISTYEVFQAVEGQIKETHALADPSHLTSYFRAMTHAYALVREAAAQMDLALTTIHPAAVYGGLNTGDGFTNYLENLLRWRIWRLPFIVPGRFPVVHADSLAAAIILSMDHTGAYIVSDQMTSLKEMAVTLRLYAHSYVPLTAPLWLASPGTAFLEFAARLTRIKPIMARVQLNFISKGWEPHSEHAQVVLGWTPWTLAQGIKRYLEDRKG